MTVAIYRRIWRFFHQKFPRNKRVNPIDFCIWHRYFRRVLEAVISRFPAEYSGVQPMAIR
jgi:hypothetical protein